MQDRAFISARKLMSSGHMKHAQRMPKIVEYLETVDLMVQ